jgi:hypothetical protein
VSRDQLPDPCDGTQRRTIRQARPADKDQIAAGIVEQGDRESPECGGAPPRRMKPAHRSGRGVILSIAPNPRRTPMQRTLVTLGLTLLLIGLAWPWLGSMPFGRLPGDIVIERENFRLYLPLTTMIVVSAALSLILWLLRH